MAEGSNWESILKWSLSQSDGTKPTRKISEEERKWFQEAVSVTQIDVVRRMKEIATVMQIPQENLEAQGVTVQELEGLLEELQEHVESIDMANDLQAIGGLVPLLSFLRSPHASLRSRAAEVVTTVVQNNPRSQANVMEAGGFPLLLANFTSDADITARTKALGALSSLIRHNEAGLGAFRLAGGIAALRDALQVDSTRLQRKALYVLQYLMQEKASDRRAALDLGLGPILASLATSSDADVRQAALQSLLSISLHGSDEARRLAEETAPATSEGGKNLREVLSGRMEDLQTLEGQDLELLLEERHLVDQLWEQCFAGGARVATAGSRSEAEQDLIGGGTGPALGDGMEEGGGRPARGGGPGVGSTAAAGEGTRAAANRIAGGDPSANQQQAPVLLLGAPGGGGGLRAPTGGS